MRQYLAGWSLKLTAILAKLAFLSIAITELQDGVFYTYFIFATAAIGASRFLSASGEEQIPIELRKRPDVEQDVSSTLALFCIITATVNFSSLFSPFPPLTAILSLSLSVAFTALVGGTIRVNHPLLYETISNVPYILFVALYILLRPTAPEQLIQHLSASFFVTSTLATLIHYGTNDSLPEFRPTRHGLLFLLRLYSSWRAWAGKSISSAAILFNLRYPVFVLLIFVGGESDDLALALSIGEVSWQLAMIIVNRKLSYFFKNRTPPLSAIVQTIKGLLITSAIGAAAAVSSGFVLYFLHQMDQPELLIQLDHIDVASSIFLSMTFSCFSFYRVACFYLESNDLSIRLTNYFFVQALILAVNSVLLLIFIESVWIAMVLGGIINAAIPLLFCFRWLQRSNRAEKLRTNHEQSSAQSKS